MRIVLFWAELFSHEEVYLPSLMLGQMASILEGEDITIVVTDFNESERAYPERILESDVKKILA
ncbi:hypothetical protein ACFL96_16555, partial [Thermoproteota archaeon]